MYASKRARRERRGVVLLIVLGLLGLFAAVGVSFAVLGRAAGRGAQDFRRSRQDNNGPAPRELLKSALDQLIFDTTNPQSALRGHSLLRDMYGGWDRRNPADGRPLGLGAELRVNPDGSRMRDYAGAFNGPGIFSPRRVLDGAAAADQGVIGNGVLSQEELIGTSANGWNGSLLRLFVPREFGDRSSDPAVYANAAQAKRYFPFLPHNFQVFDAIGPSGSPLRGGTAPMGGTALNSGSGSGQMPTPELYAYQEGGVWRYHWFPFDEDYDAADFNNWYLALERADGSVIVPSFHRPHMVRQLELAGVFGSNPNTFPAYTGTAVEDESAANPVLSGRRVLFRPRHVDVDYNTVMGTGLPANFPTLRDLNGNNIFGDMPEELDVDTDGDGKPDAVWVDLGTRPFRQEDGTLVKPLYAFKVVAMDGKINLNLAGNFVVNPLAPRPRDQLGVEGRPEGHVSAFGASPAEINPRHALTLDQQNQSGGYWPRWIQPNPNGDATDGDPPVYLDPIYLRFLLSGLPPLSNNGTTMPATGDAVSVAGRWSNPNAVSASFVLDRPGQRFTDDDGSMPAAFNANIPTEDQNGGMTNTPRVVRGTVSSSLGPVGFQAGRRFPPFSRRAAALAPTTPANSRTGVDRVFPQFVNHVHNHFRDGRSYWPGYVPPTPFTAASQVPAMSPTLTSGSGSGEFDVPGSMNIAAPRFAFDLSAFGLTGTGFALPTAPDWYPTPGVLAVNNNSFPAYLQALQTLMATDDANEHNPYLPTASYNSPFTNAQVEALLRFNDIDGSTLDDRLAKLLAFNVGGETSQAVGTPYALNYVQSARDRMRRLFTAESWDLINYSNPPAFGDQANVPPTTNNMTYAGGAATLRNSRNPPTPNDAAVYAPSGNFGVQPTTNGSEQHNGFLWRPAGNTPETPLGHAFYSDNTTNANALTRVSAQALLGSELAGRYPIEVLRGRRYDLNRPLTSFESHPKLADAERTAMAEQVYVLLYVSAGLNMRPLPVNVEEAREALAQARTLAQLAVNIVDYIDPDTVMTEMRFHPFLTRQGASGEWDTIETLAAGATQAFTFGPVASTFTVSPTAEELTVIGFEMPDLVISEGVSVTDDRYETKGKGKGKNKKANGEEATFVWAELYNPWPNETDLDAGATWLEPSNPNYTVVAPTPRGRLFDTTPAPAPGGGDTTGRRTRAQSRFVLGVRQNKVADTVVAPTAPTGGDFQATTQRFVHFTPAPVAGNGVTIADGAFTTPRNQAGNGPDLRGGQRLLVEPNLYAANNPGNGQSDSDPVDLIADPGRANGGYWDPASGPNRFTTTRDPTSTAAGGTLTLAQADDTTGLTDLRIVRVAPNPKTNVDNSLALSLYRVRNPYRDWHPVSNPYVAIDTLELRGNGADATADQSQAEGSYQLGTDRTQPPLADRRSMERKQPWHGSKRPWVPYRGPTGMANPMTTLVNTPAGGVARFLEGKFLGFPYLTADATTAGTYDASMTTQTWGNQLVADGFARAVNSAANSNRGHTLYSDNETATPQASATPYATNFTATQNTVDNARPSIDGRYISFPFLNRQLASPLELLSVRLYGVYPWAVPNYAAGTPAPASPATANREWRLRFTDDFEFRQDPITGLTTPNYPAPPGGGFNRVYRSREVPWFLNDRKLHPMDATVSPTYDPAASANRMAPFPNLYRFFELVETRSRVNGAGGWGTRAASIASSSGADLRESRVAGKINPNVIADEEILKALLDDESALALWVQNNSSVKFGNSAAVAAGLNSSDFRYRPVNYPTDLYPAVPSASLPQAAVRGLAWNGDVSELLMSRAVDNTTNNRNFICSTPTGSTQPIPIDFGGIETTLGTVVAAYPGGDLSQSANSYKRLIHNQFPGIVNGYYGYNPSAPAPTPPLTDHYPGWHRDVQVASEFFRAFVFSRNGRDALWGTADDKPFHGFGSSHLSDTLLRRRNYAHLDLPNDGRYASTASPTIQGSGVPSVGNNPGAPGEYIARLGGQWTPRLFDPVPLPYTLDNNPTDTASIGPSNTITMARRADVALDTVDTSGATVAAQLPKGVEYWMLEWRRNELLGKIASNTTSRSNVFGVWVTVGFFRVEPGTENLLVPLLHEEVGSANGTQKRHRMFAVLDRTQAKEFTELMTTSPPKIEDNAVIRHHSFIE